jgi:hypothetical protein
MEGINPVIGGVLKETGERLELLRNAHQFRVTAIYDWSKPLKEELFDMARIFCIENKIGFSVRAFDNSLEEDREEVIRLPAFHVYYDFEYERTVYLEDSIRDSVLEIIAKYKAKKWSFSWPNVRMFSAKRRIVPVLSSHSSV